MALIDETGGGNNSNSNSEVSLSAKLAVELDTLNDALHSQDRLLKRDVRERNDFKAKH
jgi:hypothetical protein